MSLQHTVIATIGLLAALIRIMDRATIWPATTESLCSIVMVSLLGSKVDITQSTIWRLKKSRTDAKQNPLPAAHARVDRQPLLVRSLYAEIPLLPIGFRLMALVSTDCSPAPPTAEY